MTLIKTFRAASLQAAIEKVRSELGPDASILETKPLPRTLTRFLSSDRIEVVASSTTIPRSENSNDTPPTTAPNSPHPTDESSVDLPADNIHPKSIHETTLQQRRATNPNSTYSANRPPNGAVQDQPSKIEAPLQSNGIANPVETKNDWDATLTELVSAGIEKDIATQWLEEIYEDQLEEASSETIRHLLVQSLQSQLPPCSAIDIEPESPRQVIALVGPTGSGKTTCVAKLAAILAQQAPNSVGVLSLDTLRVGAIDQLNHYTSILNIPLIVAAEPEQIDRAMQSLANCSVILIDTPGMGPKDEERINQTAHLLSLCRVDQVHLCLPATYARATIERVLDTFGPLTPSHGILTQMDFATAVGNLFPVLKDLNEDADNLKMQLSYISNGQQVPTHLAETRPTHLAIKMLGSRD